jgi:hypothetical protein
MKENSKKNNSDKTIDYYLTLIDPATGGFGFARHQPATLMATSYAVLGLEFIGGLSTLTDEQTDKTINFLMAGMQKDGSFEDPLFRFEDILSQSHDITYFQQETTTFCQQALDALDAPPPKPRDFSAENWDSPEGIISYFESFAWKNPWLDSNRVMFALSQLCHDADRHGRSELLKVVDVALDWLDQHQSSETGLWKGPYAVSLTNAMAATFHFTFYYGYRKRPLLYLEPIIDSCLKLQQKHGLFDRNKIGQTCLDYDALDLLAKASLVTNYRSEEVNKAMDKASKELIKLSNPDGGFANCKEQIIVKGKANRLIQKLRLEKYFKFYSRVPTQGQYSVCWKLLSCDTKESNAFSTWFRLLALRLADQRYWLNTTYASKFAFRRLPFLGYHDPSAILKIYQL